MKYSIIVPVYNQLRHTQTCIQSIRDNTQNWDDYELIVVANGCTDGTEEFILSVQEHYKANTVLLSYKNPLGFGGAINAGMRVSQGEYVILLNNDCKILSPLWLPILEEPFHDPKNPAVGITGPILYWSEITKMKALIFFCVMIRREVINKVGYLDTVNFPIGAGEDTDYCARAQKLDFLLEQVPKNKLDQNSDFMIGGFPIYHIGEATLNTMPEWNERLYWEHREALKRKYAEVYPNDKL